VDQFADLFAKSALLCAYGVVVIVAYWAAEKVLRRS